MIRTKPQFQREYSKDATSSASFDKTRYITAEFPDGVGICGDEKCVNQISGSQFTKGYKNPGCIHRCNKII
jgi:hypothetical protein